MFFIFLRTIIGMDKVFEPEFNILKTLLDQNVRCWYIEDLWEIV